MERVDDRPMSDETGPMPASVGPGDRSEPGVPASRAGPPRPVLIGLGVAAAIVLVLVAVLLLRPGDEPVGEASPSPTAIPTLSPTAATTPSETAQPSATPAATAPAIPESWSEAARFSEAGKRYALGDLVTWSGSLVAVGTLYDEPGRGVFGPPPPHTGIVWRSADGTDWTDATPDGTFDQVELAHLFETSDGALIVIGTVWGSDANASSRAWETHDGQSWAPIELNGVPSATWINQVASGARGHAAGPYYSADGRNWELTLAETQVASVAAGDEGFVASDGTATQVVASADGREWFDAVAFGDGSLIAAPRGGDWIATTTAFDTQGDAETEVATWRSADGLEWSHVADFELGSFTRPDLTCFEVPDVLHGLASITVMGTTLFGMCGEGAIVSPGASYATLDGASWMKLPFGDQTYAAGAAMAGGRVVIGTDGRTNAPVTDVVFWISEAP